MANTGYITSSGIDQIFTTGPYSGSIVTSSYSSGSILLGPTITRYQAFISGTIDVIVPCTNPNGNYPIFERYYYDPIDCPMGDCLPPIITNTSVAFCDIQDDYTYILSFNSGSTNALYSTLEYSTVSNFSSNTGSYIVTNSLNNYTSSIDISNLPLLPLKTTEVYFRVFNSCSLGGTSSYSPITSASCQVTPPPPFLPFTLRLKNSMVGINNTLYYTNNGVEFSIFGGNTVDLTISTLGSLTIPFRTLMPEGSVRTLIISGSTPSIEGFVTTTLNDDTLNYFGDNVYQSVNIYPSNLYYNSEGTPDASIIVDRSLWSDTGLIEVDFTSITPPNNVNPWFYELQDIEDIN
jgi:hypothetical protein